MSAEAPRLETPCQVESGTVLSHDATRPCRDNTRRPLRGVATPVATAPPRTMSRVQTCVATDSEDVLHLRVGEGRDRMVKRGRCASWCLSPLMVEMALQGESRSRGVSLLPP
jgi:hypothetical protein